MRSPSQAALASLLLLGAVVAGNQATAAVARPIGIKGMAALAEVVAEGEVQSVHAQWIGGRIFREVTFVADRVLKGPYKSGQPITLWAPGGEVGDLGQWVPGAPEFVQGERVLLFLEPRPIGYVVVGMSLGKLRTERDDAGETWVVRDPDAGLGAPRMRLSWATVLGVVRASR